MARKIRTTVVLTAKAEAILMKYRNAFGLKGPLSVGLELFDALPREEQFRRIDESEATDHPQAEGIVGTMEQLKSLVARVDEAQYRVLSEEEQRLVTEIRRQLGPESRAERLAREVVEGAVADVREPKGTRAQKRRSVGG